MLNFLKKNNFKHILAKMYLFCSLNLKIKTFSL